MADFHERRQRYRAQVPDSLPVSVHLEIDKSVGGDKAAELLDLSAGGAGVRCVSPAPVALGQALAMIVSMPQVTLRLEAVVVSKIDLADGCRLGLQFKEEIDPDLDLPGPVREVLNRRRAVRVAPETPVEVVLRSIDDTTGETQVMGLLIDVSVSGIGAWFDQGTLQATESLVLASFELEPGVPLDFAARMRDWKRGAGPRVRYTFEFDPDETIGFTEQVRQLARYIKARQLAFAAGR